MKNLKKVARTMVILLLILVGSLSQLPFQVPSVSAHNDSVVHTYMSEEGANLLPEGSAMRNEIFSYMGDIRWGAYDEDHTDHVYADLTYDIYGILAIPHYWDADRGPWDRVKNIFGEEDMFPNAYQKSLELFQMALDEYPTDLSQAYEYLGHVAHLIEDQTVPAHVHEDFHPGIAEWADILGLVDLVGGGDDSFEEWIYESGAYDDFGAGSALAAGGLVTFPDDVEEEMRQGNWARGLYYLMYTTNQYADYFASDDENGDTVDIEGWMDYSGFPARPTRASQLNDNDRYWDWLLMMYLDDDNDDDGDLSTIASYTYVYGIRAVATLYKMFYEATHPPEASISIDYVDEDSDGSDYRWVYLDLTYDVGADEYVWDLEARFRNEGEAWPPSWEGVTRRRPWTLSEGDGTKTVYYQVRNLMGLTTTNSDTVELVEIGVPQLFNYEFNATGAQSLSAHVEFFVDYIWGNHESGLGDGTLEFYHQPVIDDGFGTFLTARTQLPTVPPGWDIAWYNVPIGGQVGPLGDVIDVYVAPGSTVRLRTRGRDEDPGPDDPLGGVWTDADPASVGTEEPYTVPTEPGVHWLESGRYFVTAAGEVNDYYELWVSVRATVTAVPWSDSEGPWESFVRYGAPEEWIADASEDLTAPADRVWPYPSTTEWQVEIDNDAIGYRMDGRSLYAWTTASAPDMVVAGLSPVHLLITDPDGNRIGTRRYWTGMAYWDPWLGIVMIYETETYNEVPGASVVQVPTISGDQITLIVFDQREVGDYQVQVSPMEGAVSTDTYSIGISSQWRRGAVPHPFPPRPRQMAFLVESVQVGSIPAEPYVMQSTDASVNLPPHADADGPYWASEGTAINFDASGSSDPDGDSLTYRWDFEDDGAWDTDWSSSPTASHTWNDDWTGTARVEVSDGTITDTATATVTVSNVAPTVNAGPNQLAAVGEEVHFSGSFTDPGADTHTREWDFGDGTIITDMLTPTHVFSEARKHTVTLTVTDDDGGVGTDTLTVNTGVEVTIEPPSAFVPPGETTTYNVIIHHLGKTEDTYNLELYGLDAAWYSLSTTSVTLDPDQSETVTLTVSPPCTATIRVYGFTVAATSQTDPTVFDTADADAIVGDHLYAALNDIRNLMEYVISLYESGDISQWKYDYIISDLEATRSDIINAMDYLEGVRHGFDDRLEGLYALYYAVKRLEYLKWDLQHCVKWGYMPRDIGDKIIEQLESINMAMTKKARCEALSEKMLAEAAVEDSEERGKYAPWLRYELSYIEKHIADAEYWLEEGWLYRAAYYFKVAFWRSQRTITYAYDWSWDISLEDWIDQLEANHYLYDS